MIGPMDPPEQAQWLTTHIPHRVRAAIARLPMENSILRGTATIDPHCRTEQDHIYWRCATDSIWEGRLAATRWLIEFVGIKQDDAGQAAVCRKSKKFGGKDVRIDDLDGGVLLDHRALEAHLLGSVWKGCSQASSHATNEYKHPPVSNGKELPEALTIIAEHLQNTIYQKAGKNLRDYVLEPVK
jgi:hypothetical protein